MEPNRPQVRADTDNILDSLLSAMKMANVILTLASRPALSAREESELRMAARDLHNIIQDTAMTAELIVRNTDYK
jgi:hypothetical protein